MEIGVGYTVNDGDVVTFGQRVMSGAGPFGVRTDFFKAIVSHTKHVLRQVLRARSKPDFLQRRAAEMAAPPALEAMVQYTGHVLTTSFHVASFQRAQQHCTDFLDQR